MGGGGVNRMFGICMYPFAFENLEAMIYRGFADVKPCGAI